MEGGQNEKDPSKKGEKCAEKKGSDEALEEIGDGGPRWRRDCEGVSGVDLGGRDNNK